jgi:hypothetical protein
MQDPIRTHERKLVGVEFVDDDGGKHLVFRSTAAFDNAPNSNFVRRMTSIPRLLSAMSGEGLLLDSDKFRKQLVGNARQSSFGIIAVNPTWASEYDLSKLSSLPVIKSTVEFDKLLRGGVDTLSSYTDTGKIDNLSHLEKALMNIELVFAAVFDNSWRGCNQTPLLFIRTQDIQLIPLGFPVTYLEMAMKAFNDLVKNKYIPNPDCPTHPKSLQSLQSVLQLWKALIDPVVSTCMSPTQLNVYYRLYGYNNSMGRVPTSSERESLAVWGTVLSDKPKGILKKQARSDSDGDSMASSTDSASASKLRTKRKRDTAKTAKAKKSTAKVTPQKKQVKDMSSDEEPTPQKKAKVTDKRVKIVTPPKQGAQTVAPTSVEYCLLATLALLGLGGKCTRPSCRFQHPIDKNAIKKEKLFKEIKNSNAKSLTPEKKAQIRAILNGSMTKIEVKDE